MAHKLNRRQFIQASSLALASTIYLPYIQFNQTGTRGPTLRSLADQITTPVGAPFWIGIELEPGDKEDPTGIPVQMGREQFNHRVVKGVNIIWEWERGHWDFSVADDNVERALAANQTMSGMELIWSWEDTVPDWLKNGGYSREQVIEIMQEHITCVMQHYKGVIGAYEVVNEAFNSGPGGEDWWNNHIGPDYVELAFQAARAADPQAILFYNHYNNHTIGDKNYIITKADIDNLKAKGLVDAVGVQLHLWGGRPVKADVIAAFQSYGLPVWVTEFDSYQNASLPYPAQEQADITRAMLEAALESGVCQYFIFWGVNDLYSCWGADAKANLWDKDQNAKANYYAVQQVLENWASLQRTTIRQRSL